MKKTILISILFLFSASVFAQEKIDSVKTKPIKYLVDFSLHNLDGFGSQLGDGTGSYSWQSDLTFGINFRRHTILTGISGGPGLSFSNHYVSNNSIDYHSYDPDYSKWGIYGANLSYQFQFNSLSKNSKSSLEFYSSFSRYKNIHDDGYPNDHRIVAKNILQALIGYSYTRKTRSGFAFGFQILAGIFYNIDTTDYPNRPSPYPDPSHFEWVKLFPTLMLKPTISYTF